MWPLLFLFFFFFSSRRRHTRSLRDWSSDVCSSDLGATRPVFAENAAARQCDGLHTIADVELGEETAQLGLDRVLTQVQVFPQLAVGHAGREEREQLTLSFCEIGLSTGPAELGRDRRPR